MKHLFANFYYVESRRDLNRAAQHIAKSQKPVTIFENVKPASYPVIVVLNFQKKYHNVNLSGLIDESEIPSLSLAFLDDTGDL